MSYSLGVAVRDFLRGLLGSGDVSAQRIGPALFERPERPMTSFGLRVDSSRLKMLYGPGRKVEKFQVSPPGIDNLALSSTDVFYIPGRGEFSVDFKGYFQVARQAATTKDWATAFTFVNMTDLRLQGQSRDLGPMTVRLNPGIVSSGQVFPAGASAQAAKCRIATGAMFTVEDMGLTAFNKEPILLKNDAIESIPPVEDPNGLAHIYDLPLYDNANPDGEPVAYLRSLRYTVGNYISESDANAIRAAIR